MKKTPGMRALLYSGDLLAVDLGTFAVKVLSLKSKERSLTVHGFAQREVWRELSEAKSEEEKAEIYSRTLREIMAENAFKPRNASISLSGGSVILRFPALPPGTAPDLEAGLPSEARALVPFEEADALVSALVLDAPKGVKNPRVEMMLTIAERKSVQGGMQIVRKAGMRPAVIINDALAFANAYEFFEGRKAEETVVLVAIGAASTSICVVENGVMRAARVVNIAGNVLTRAVKREFNLDLVEAERLKIAFGVAAAGGKAEAEDPIPARVARALRPALKDLGVEIHRTIDVFLERRPADHPPIVKIVVAGGSAELKGLSAALAAETGMLVDIFRPMVNTLGKGGALGIAPLAAGLAGPCGLALSNTLLRRTHKPRINLVPRKARRSAIIRDVSPGYWRLIAGPVFVGLALCLYGFEAVRVSREEAAIEVKLEAAAAAERALEIKFTKKKKEVVAPVKRVENPFAFLAKLSISGVFGDRGSALVMLHDGGASFIARGGKLFDVNEAVIPGVASELNDHALVLTAGGRRYSIDLPK